MLRWLALIALLCREPANNDPGNHGYAQQEPFKGPALREDGQANAEDNDDLSDRRRAPIAPG